MHTPHPHPRQQDRDGEGREGAEGREDTGTKQRRHERAKAPGRGHVLGS